MEYTSYKDIDKFNFSVNHSEPLRDLATMIDLVHYSDYISYHVVDGDSTILVEFNYSPKYNRVFASFEGDGIVHFYVMDSEENITPAGYMDTHSYIGVGVHRLKSIFEDTLKKNTGASIYCFD